MSEPEVVIYGKRYEVVEWSLEDSDCDGAGTYRWVLYAMPVAEGCAVPDFPIGGAR